MSFSFEFVAVKADAAAHVEAQRAPQCVKDFLFLALSAFTDEKLVSVKAAGHLCNHDYNVSTATIDVHELHVLKGAKQ